MPAAIPVILAGAGLYLGARWLARELSRKAEAARRAAEDSHGPARKGTAPRDLGALVLDPETGAYVPRGRG
jgi:hypothetical protein